jgi:hypothetical protein
MNRKKLYYNVAVYTTTATAANPYRAEPGAKVIIATFRCTRYTATQPSTEKFGGFLSRLAQATSTTSNLNLVKHELKASFAPTALSIHSYSVPQFLVDFAGTTVLTNLARATNFMVRLWATAGATACNIRRLAGTLVVERQHSIEV